MIDKQAKRQNKSQHREFVETARALECDESEERFDEALKKVAGHKPSLATSAEPKDRKSKPAT